MEQTINTENFVWRPPLIRLTQIGAAGIRNGGPTPLFINPDCIELIVAHYGKLINKDAMEAKGIVEPEPMIECTMVGTHQGHNICVLETPEQVAMLRDKALGHAPKPLSEVK